MGDVGSNGGECGCGEGFTDFLGIWRDVGGYLLNLQIEIQQSLRFGDVLDVYYGDRKSVV